MNNLGENSIKTTNIKGNNFDRNTLPFRKKTELILLNHKGNLLVEDHGSYLMFPGGGIDEGETDIKESAKRELFEETGLILDGDLKYLGNVSWKWFPERANNEKRKKRYEEFQGEESYFYIGKTNKPENIKLSDEDSWKNIDGIPLDKAIKKFVELANEDHPNTYPYRIAQLNSLRTLAIINGIKIPQEDLSIFNRM